MSCEIEILKHTHTHIYSHSHNIKKSSWSSAHNNHLGLFSLLLLLLLLLSNARHKAVKFFLQRVKQKKGDRAREANDTEESIKVHGSVRAKIYYSTFGTPFLNITPHRHIHIQHACMHAQQHMHDFVVFTILSPFPRRRHVSLACLVSSSHPYPTPQGTVTYAKTTTTAHHHPPSHRTVNSTKKCLNVGIVGLLSKSCYPTYDDYYYYYYKKRQEKRLDVL